MNIDAHIEALKAAIRDVPDFPKPGIVFKDITTLLAATRCCCAARSTCSRSCAGTCASTRWSRSRAAASSSAARSRSTWASDSSRCASPESCPWRARKASYALEYGTDSLEIHEDAVGPADHVLIVDDVIATGGTAQAVASLCEGLGAHVSGYLFLVELAS